ncbi:MAG: LPS-assembly protein LptD [bacterium]|nr:LPS-assembly protein LptD [bacterium]
MSSKQTVISGERLTFNLKERTGIMYDTYGQLPPTLRYNTDELKQVDNDTLTFNKLTFTSCSQCTPRWKITCGKGKIKKEKYIAMKNVVFRIKNIPIFYFPYLRYPVNKEGRATGLLFPGIGTSNKKGFFMQNAFFWAIKDNVDLTLNVDYFGKAGLGLAEEFRYKFRSMEGNIRFYYFKYKEGNIIKPEGDNDYIFEMKHRQTIDFLNTRITVNIDKQSDASFMKLFSNDFYAALRRISRSSVSLDSSLANFKLSVGAQTYDTYFTFNDQSTSVRYMPSLKFSMNHQKLWKFPGYLSLDTSYAIIQRIGKSYDADDDLLVDDVTSKRLNIAPSYTINLARLPFLAASLKISSKHSFYPQSKSLEDSNEIVDVPLHLSYNYASLNVVGPIFYKISQFKKFKLKHIIKPKIICRYTTKVDDEDRDRMIPVDYFDYPSFSFVGFELQTSILYKNKVKANSSPKEILSYSIRQDYYFDPSLAHRGRSILGLGEMPEFSSLSNTLRIRPMNDVSLDAQVTYNHTLRDFTRIRINLGYTNKDSFINGNFFYNTYKNEYAQAEYVFNRDSIGGALNFDHPHIPLKLRAGINYDITEKEFRYGSFKLFYDYQCVKFRTELRLFKYDGRMETQWKFGVSFGNLGQVKDFLGIEK